MTGEDTEPGLAGEPSLEERRLQAKLDAGTITEEEYARLTAMRFGEDPDAFSVADAAEFYDLTADELREEMAWLSDASADPD